MHSLTGVELLHDPHRNRGTAFSDEERDRLRLRGLLPPRILTQEQQAVKVMENFHRLTSDLERHIYMIALQDRNEQLFYRVLMDHLEEMMPVIYTPTVGLACQQYGHIWRRPRGLFITAEDRGRIGRIMRNWPNADVRTIVVTDGERILGLGDLGANGMGIPVGKLSLYTACAGVDPTWCLPITLDVGTENEALLNDPFYIGLPRRRLTQDAYDVVMAEFMHSVRVVFPRALVQFEDFSNKNAFRFLEKYREHTPCFNDDIQGTAGVALAGLYSALRLLSSKKLGDQKFLFLGAGEAGTGIGSLLVRAMVDEGLTETEARQRCWLFDSQGLVVRSRSDLPAHKRPFAHDHAAIADLLSAVIDVRPTALIGVSGQPQTFTQPVIAAMSAINARPIIFALSNPTAYSECTAEQAYAWSEGRAIFASGSPFAAVDLNGRTFAPGQANNAYIFPGVGLGIIASGARRVIDEMFLAAARTLANCVGDRELARGSIFPPLHRIREISASIAVAVAELAYERNIAVGPRPHDLATVVAGKMYRPDYEVHASRRSGSLAAVQ
jgi:malate dehydrogenase (oxaloacetate-decarboxylating)(NADP+)